ncbi:hypothetical protein PICMEDRAFT_165299 [Pichia membranifaciens NRRL Y-2026]|uniref:Temperature shock-inducible protein 1 n=1 Tax=Pichia membranifaciens NRRL Y-2026 TaxID=763406 RepID=A0A1E3NFZ4_9ASCO|nr:hypothetical protein PICMEDRAFT_165299 [Pichia membranifaciens NRRL Y-2026]ODQ45060.1 hypothetical protein PICMEDRAFT_165299 [Pichia membranifaciens NRRL Y-2026]
MQLSHSVLISVAALVASTQAEDLLVALNSDIQSNPNQYLSFVQEHTTANVGPLLSLYQQAQTYTDDSYTTLVDSSELASISSFATELPWYSSRIAPELGADATTTDASGSARSSAAPRSSEARSSEARSSHAASSHAASSHDASSHAASSHAAASSDSASASASQSAPVSSIASSSSTAGAVANAYAAPGAGLAFALGVMALL